jgi:hypothetical protein
MDRLNESDSAIPKGKSLGQDAWRRLRSNRRAMVSLFALASIGLLAFLTPLLPLQPPDRDQTKDQFKPPQYWPLFEPTFDFDWAAIEQVPEQLSKARQELGAAQEMLDAASEASPESKEAARSAENWQTFYAAPIATRAFPKSVPSAAGWCECGTECSANGRSRRFAGAMISVAISCPAFFGGPASRSWSASLQRAFRY